VLSPLPRRPASLRVVSLAGFWRHRRSRDPYAPTGLFGREDEVPAVMLPSGMHRLYTRPWVQRLAARHFHRAYYYAAHRTLMNSHWLGTTTVKMPLDLWSYQEIISEVRPGLVVETGTFRGGSALFLASVLDLLDTGRVMSIDLKPRAGRPEHPRIDYLEGSSVDPEVVDRVREAARAADGPVLVILDSAHERDHVLAELRAYADLVTPGSYVIVEDTDLNGNPILPNWGPGPREAVEDFLAERRDFAPDRERERFLMTMNPGGFLRRAAPRRADGSRTAPRRTRAAADADVRTAGASGPDTDSQPAR
jgi:cephalosporin hydroxylase